MEQDQMLNNEMRGFDDERINYESGRIYQWGILWAVLYTAVFALSRLLFLGNAEGVSLSLFISEIAVIVSGAVILLIGLIRWGFGRDERRVAEKHRYYLTAGKVFLITAVAGYALSIPLRSQSGLNDYPINELLMQLEVLGCVYFFFAFKRRQISFNYTFIHETGWGYYGHVLRNIGRLALYALIPFGAAAVLDLLTHMSTVYFNAIGIAYALTVYDLGLCYFLLSLLEKLNYDEESPKNLKRGTFIALIIAIGKQAEVFICQILAAWVAQYGMTEQLPEGVTFGELLAEASTDAREAAYPALVAAALALCFLMEQTRHSRRVRVGVCGYLVAQSVDLVLTVLRSAVMVALERYIEEPSAIRLFGNLTTYWSFAVWLISLAFTCLWIHGLIRDCGASKLLWLTVGLVVVCQAVGIFFGSQSMNLAMTLTVGGGALLAMAGRLVILKTGSLRTVDSEAE
ncbi:MAG: hypothetical protein IJ363_06920 [Clostridia bacterium]|nr:hypothetical protein [Clostridia bacterium]